VTALLSIEGASVTRGRTPVLSEISLSVGAGELWALVGPNGSGKTTLLEALVGALPATGAIRFNGLDGSRASPRERAQHVTLIGREKGSDAPLSVGRWVELGRLAHRAPLEPLSAEDQSRIAEALAQTHTAHLTARTLASLSDGERQRAYFARALAQRPSVLLMDEATAHLDFRHREEAFDRLTDYVREGRAVVAAVHDIELAVRRASHVAVLSAGRLVAAGATRITLTRELLGDVFGIHAELVEDAHGTALRVVGLARPRPDCPVRPREKERVHVS
jgi:iron complex transport system ATP-binding protein